MTNAVLEGSLVPTQTLSSILSPEAHSFLSKLSARFEQRRQELLARRRTVQQKLDDGWKPFWLDTIAIDAGQTQRIAFAADYPGRWLMEAVEAHWKAPRLVRWFSVD